MKTPEEQIGVSLPEPEAQPQSETAPEPSADRPEWLPENFNSPEDLASSYKELQGRLTKESQSRSTLEQQVATLQTQFEEAQTRQAPPQEDWNTQRSQLEEQYEQDPLGTMAFLASQAAQAAAAQTAQYYQQQNQSNPAQDRGNAELYATTIDQQMSQRHADWGNMKDKVGDLIQEMPGILDQEAMTSPMRAVEVLDRALEIVRNREIAAGVQQGQSGRQLKLAGQTMTGATGRGSAASGETPLSDQIKQAYQGSSWSAQRGS